jgi:beta-mannosidase
VRYPVTSALLAAVMLVCLSTLDTPASPRLVAGPLVREIAENWRFRQVGKDAWLPARVPGSNHTDLLANKAIPDPFFRDNEAKVQWIGYADWEYETAFEADASTLARDRVELVFEGLDTYATVFLNGARVLDADNMFRTWRVDAKPHLKAGSNALRIVFRSPINEVLPRMYAMKYELPAVNDQGEKTSAHTRKAPYQYGWDWGPRFVTAGVWRPVRLEAWDAARISSLYVTTTSASKAAADLSATVAIEATKPGEATVVVDGVGAPVERKVRLAAGSNTVTVPLRVEQPRLWWPNGLGEQPLYTIRTRLTAGGASDERETRIGIRTVELRQRPDEWGKSFELVVNGVPVFAKGGNWIPADSFPERVTPERYRHLLDSCRRANMNMVRVWGGGIYESDEFYDLCDEMGLLVWQDFMFACSMYPGDEQFLENVRQEAIDNVVRLRNHPSVALWCGNNEVETAWHHWGWKQRLPASLWDDYLKLFHGVLPKVVAEHDPSRAYWPSSPSSNLEDDADSQKIGDVHYWGVWHASLPFKEYEKQVPRFMSEYGFQSFPAKATVETYTLPEDWYIESAVMKAHQRHPRGNELIREYMLRDYPEPKDFDSFLYVSQVLQAEGMRIGTEHFRRSMPRTMGALYWQVDDCWPVASWSGMDYYGRWKAMHYYARRFFADVLVSATERDGAVELSVVSDRVAPARGTLRLRLLDFNGKVLDERASELDVGPTSSTVVARLPLAELAAKGAPEATFLHGELVIGGEVVSTTNHFFRPYKELALAPAALKAEVAEKGGAVHVAVTSPVLAHAVYLALEGADGSFSDNFFDVMPGGRAEVTVEGSKLSADEVRKRLRVRSLADAFKK